MPKKNIKKIPKEVFAKLEMMKSKEVVVGCAIKFKSDDLQSGKMSHIGISVDSTGLHYIKAFVPNEQQGKYSNQNINGLEIIRKDLPKETHFNAIESPNWGDSYNGTHTVYLPYKKFPRDFKPPRELEISVYCKDTQPGQNYYIIVMRVEEVLDRNSKDFNERLLENLNLLLENCGRFGVEEASATMLEYAKSLNVAWEILPPGTLDEVLERVFRGKSPTLKEKDVTSERYKFFMSFKPEKLIFGQSGFRRYFGAMLEDDMVIFENVAYGNAVYVLFGDWERLCKLSRLDLMSGRFGDSFERIIHTGKWKDKVKDIIKQHKKSESDF